VTGSREHSNGPSGSIKCDEFLSSRITVSFLRRAQRSKCVMYFVSPSFCERERYCTVVMSIAVMCLVSQPQNANSPCYCTLASVVQRVHAARHPRERK
jgi:hypothetical protein